MTIRHVCRHAQRGLPFASSPRRSSVQPRTFYAREPCKGFSGAKDDSPEGGNTYVCCNEARCTTIKASLESADDTSEVALAHTFNAPVWRCPGIISRCYQESA